MPSFRATQPNYSPQVDMLDPKGPNARDFVSALAALQTVQATVRRAQNFTTGGVPGYGSYFIPENVSAANRVLAEYLIEAIAGAPVPIAGTRTSAVIFTPTTSEAWPVNGLTGWYVYSYVAAAPYVGTFSLVASNTATAVTVDSPNLTTSADRILVLPLPVFNQGASDLVYSLNKLLSLT